MSTIATAFLSILLSAPVPPVLETTIPEDSPAFHEIAGKAWLIERGDSLVLDTQKNEGFLVHQDGRYYRFPVVTGQRRRVWYIGRSYFAATPNRLWTARSLDSKGDRVTFGPSGRFLRLYDGDETTAYGLHEHRDEDEMFSESGEGRFRSMGCVIVQTEILDLLVATWILNGEELEVISQYGIENLQDVILTRNAQNEDGKKS